MAENIPTSSHSLPIPTSEDIGSRNRVMTNKGLEYNAEIKRKIAINKEKEFLTKLSNFELFIKSSSDSSEIKNELLTLTTEADIILRLFDDWIHFLRDTTEIQQAFEKKTHIVDFWQSVFSATQTRLRQLLEDDTKSVTSSVSRRSQRSSASSSSSKMLVDCKAKKAALQEKMRFRSIIAEQERKLEQLKLQQQLEELKAQEAIYQQATDDENKIEDVTTPVLPQDSQYILSKFLNSSQPNASSTPVTNTNAAYTHVATGSNIQKTVTVTSTPIGTSECTQPLENSQKLKPTINFVQLQTNHEFEEGCNAQHISPHTASVAITPSYSTKEYVPPVIPTPRLNESSRPFITLDSYNKSNGNQNHISQTGYYPPPQDHISQPGYYPPPQEHISQPAYYPSSQDHTSKPVYYPPPQDNSVLLADTLAKVTQLQRLPQAKPDIFKGDEKDKTKFFLWENAFDALIDSVPITPQQKLHLLYQHLDGKAKKVVEQLQYMVNDPEYAYHEARKILKDRFGHRAVIGTEFEKRLLSWPRIGPTDASALEEYGDFLRQVEIASEHIESLKVFNFPSQVQLLVEKLPGWFKTKWSDKVMKLQREDGKDAFPSFKEFVGLVCYEAERMNIPQIAQASHSTTTIQRPVTDSAKSFSRYLQRKSKNPSVTTLATSSVSTRDKASSNDTVPEGPASKEPRNVFCFYHNLNSHSMSECEQFSKLSFDERKDFLAKKRICFNCVESDKHVAKKCSRSKPECKICQRKHATLLHDPSKHTYSNDGTDRNSNSVQPQASRQTKENEAVNKVNSACTQVCGQTQSGRLCARIVLLQVFHQEDPSIRIPTYAVLDDQSTDVFVTESLLDHLKAKGQDVTLEISTITGVSSIRTQKIHGLRIQDVEGHYQPIKISSAYTRDQIPANQEDIATPQVAHHWSHLSSIAHHIHHRSDVEIGMLIGRNVPTAFQPLRVIYGKEDEPWAEEYKFGWTIIGPVCLQDQSSRKQSTTVNRIATIRENSNSNKDDLITALPLSHKVQSRDVTSPQQIKNMMQLDYNELHYNRWIRGTEQVESVEDKRFNYLLEKGIHINETGNLEMPLPFKSDDTNLPNNRNDCLKRLLQLKRKLLKNDKARADYIDFMQKIIERNHASRVPEGELETTKGKVWYLPHFEVYHPKKPEQIRVVFDCSAVSENDSLNKHLLQGPDWMNALVGVLSRFRKEEIVVTCDIEQMFHSFYVNPEQRDFLRFLWYENNDLQGPIVEYRMNVHLFGAVSSPGVANFGLRKTADQGREQFGNEAADFLKNEFYVDDGLKSFPTPEKAVDVILKSQAMCAANKLRLHKFASNSKTVLSSISAEDRAKDIKDLDLHHDILPIQRSLGIYWCIESDTLGFRIQLKDKPCTRRGILSTVCSVYDPLGIASPVILVGKQILQDLCRYNVDWDEPISDEIYSRWEKWRSQLPLLEHVKINRCVKPRFGEPKTVQIHSFADASDDGLGQVSYLRLVNNEGQVNVSFLIAKARVAPLKPMSTPRRELTAAVISVNVTYMLSQELAYDNIQEIYYTDSSAVLGYINNDAKRFQCYVGNRVQHIRDRSDPHQWHHIDGDSNPADEASRGLTAEKLLENTRWFQGPGFLWQKEIAISNQNPILELDPQDKEVKKNASTVLVSSKEQEESAVPPKVNTTSRYLEAERFICSSSLSRLKRSIVRIQRMIEKQRPNKQYNWRPFTGPILVKELKDAEIQIYRILQRQYFGKEIDILYSLKGTDAIFQNRKNARERNYSIKQSSCLYRLDPFLDEDGLLRVGGRIRQADVPLETKHPLILPKRSHITELVIQHFHAANHHQGYGMTHNLIRQNGLWIINGRSTVSRFISKCVTCRKLRSGRLAQKMADLPPERITPSAPFTFTGMDVFGPWYIKEGRKELKRWGIVFTCLASRAVHLETLNHMNTDSFINALRRFISRRGKVQQLRSDQGSNFVGAKNELTTALGEINQDSVKDFLTTKDCDWIDFNMNVPCASHMGGIWERSIRTVRSVLAGLLRDHGTQLDDESLRTLMTEAENIVNSRPLSVENLSDATAPEPITPNHLLTLKTQPTLPHQENSQDPISILEKGGVKFNIWLNNFGFGGKGNIAHCSINVRNGTNLLGMPK